VNTDGLGNGRDRRLTPDRPTVRFHVELYVARGDVAAVARGAEAARLAAEELSGDGLLVRYRGSIFAPEDETCFLLYDADRIEDVELAATRASLSFERITELLVVQPREATLPAGPASDLMGQQHQADQQEQGG
jgi:hypothetical protein